MVGLGCIFFCVCVCVCMCLRTKLPFDSFQVRIMLGKKNQPQNQITDLTELFTEKITLGVTGLVIQSANSRNYVFEQTIKRNIYIYIFQQDITLNEINPYVYIRDFIF